MRWQALLLLVALGCNDPVVTQDLVDGGIGPATTDAEPDANTQPDAAQPVWQDTVDCRPHGRWHLQDGQYLEVRAGDDALDVWLPGRQSWLNTCGGPGTDEDSTHHTFDATRCILSLSSVSHRCTAQGLQTSAHTRIHRYQVQFDADHLQGVVQVIDRHMPDDIEDDHTSAQRWAPVLGQRVVDDQLPTCGCWGGASPSQTVDLARWDGQGGGTYRGRVQVIELGERPESWGDHHWRLRWARVEFLGLFCHISGPGIRKS